MCLLSWKQCNISEIFSYRRYFIEVNFPYLLAKFAAQQEEVFGGCLAVIGTYGPKSYNTGAGQDRFDLLSVHNWGKLKIPCFTRSVSPRGLFASFISRCRRSPVLLRLSVERQEVRLAGELAGTC